MKLTQVLLLLTVAAFTVVEAGKFTDFFGEGDGQVSPTDAGEGDGQVNLTDAGEGDGQVSLTDAGEGDGQVSLTDPVIGQEEVREERRNEVTLTEDEVGKLHKAIDLDGDGKASIEEFAQYAKDHYVATQLKDHEEEQDDPETVHWTKSIDTYLAEFEAEGDPIDLEAERARLEAADENKDGNLDQHEYFHYHHVTSDAVLEVEAQNAMKRADLNNDGSIDFDEFQKQNWRRDEEPGEDLSKEERDLFNSMDKDGDGSLNYAEFKPYSAPYHPDQDETRKLVVSADADHDGYLDVHELIGSGILDEFGDNSHIEGALSLLRNWAPSHLDL
eukprot:TRINITY_DN21041_c0_g2_i2.p1 TRINITY_DN21041_c0_g2~~TRINITY_DN21041_c0_g2_i2.p1  ORF type:complete len:330 (-),score=74.22 TRINITY_DN21041_c0_g2_i2:162-1151(-)